MFHNRYKNTVPFHRPCMWRQRSAKFRHGRWNSFRMRLRMLSPWINLAGHMWHCLMGLRRLSVDRYATKWITPAHPLRQDSVINQCVFCPWGDRGSVCGMHQQALGDLCLSCLWSLSRIWTDADGFGILGSGQSHRTDHSRTHFRDPGGSDEILHKKRVFLKTNLDTTYVGFVFANF